MNKEKYYTPEKEEFHIGFEYEAEEFFGIDGDAYYGDPGEFTNKSEWYKCSFPDKFVGYNIDKLFMYSGVRVKCLDKDDIESLGFMEKPISEYNMFYDTVCFEKITNNNNSKIEIEVSNYGQQTYNNIIIIKYKYSIKDDKYNFVIKPTVKNKSELKRLLKQLNIIDNEKV